MNMQETHPHIFSNVFKEDLLGFQTDSGLDYKAVADFLGLDKDAISKISGVSKSSVRFDLKIPREVQDRLDEIANICLLVAEFFEGDTEKTAIWFKSTNPLLGNISPRDMIRFGRYKKLMQFIIDARSESYDVSQSATKGKAASTA